MDIGEEGEEFVMRACTIEYLAPAVFDDLIEVYVRMARIGRTSVTYEFAAYRARDDELMVTATQTLVLVDLDERKAGADSRRLQGSDPGVRGRGARGVSAYDGALESIDRILDRGGDADDVLREVVAVLHGLDDFSWVGISFVEEGELVLGPAEGDGPASRPPIPISYEDNVVAELGVVAGELEPKTARSSNEWRC